MPAIKLRASRHPPRRLARNLTTSATMSLLLRALASARSTCWRNSVSGAAKRPFSSGSTPGTRSYRSVLCAVGFGAALASTAAWSQSAVNLDANASVPFVGEMQRLVYPTMPLTSCSSRPSHVYRVPKDHNGSGEDQDSPAVFGWPRRTNRIVFGYQGLLGWILCRSR